MDEMFIKIVTSLIVFALGVYAGICKEKRR